MKRIMTVCLWISLFLSFSSFWIKTEDCREEWKETKQILCPTGFSYLENLYFDSQSKIFFTIGNEIDLTKVINERFRRGYQWKKYDRAFEYRQPLIHMGNAVIVFERDSTPNHFAHFFHSLEHFLGLWNFGGENLRDEINLFLIASNGDIRINEQWKGMANETTYHLIKALFPKAEIKPWPNFLIETKQQLLHFDKVILSDRAMEEFKKEPYLTDRLLGGYFEALTKDSLDHMTKCIYDYCGVQKTHSDKLIVTYIQRAVSRKLQPNQEKELLDRLAELPNVEVAVVDFEAIPFKDQVAIAANTDVLLGVHGNGLSHTLFLPEGATLIELFPQDSFRVEYRIFAKARQLNYYGWVQGRGWIDDETVYRIGYHGNIIVDELETDVDAIITLIKTLKKANHSSAM